MTQILYRLDSLRKSYPLNEEINSKYRELRKRLSDLWFQKAERLYSKEQTVRDASVAYDSSFYFADNEDYRLRAYGGRSAALAYFGVVQKAKEEYQEAERAFKDRIRLRDVVEVFQKDILREYADEYDKLWEEFDEETRTTLLAIAQNQATDHRKAVKLLRQNLRDKPQVKNNRLVYFENSHVHIFAPFKEWVIRNAV